MDGDLSDDRTDRGSDEDATDEYYHEDSDDSHEEFIQDRDFMHRIQQNPQLQTDQAALTVPYEKLPSEAFAHTVSESTTAQQQYEQHIQEEPRHQQVGLHVTSLPSQAPLSCSSTYVHDPQSLMSTVALKPPSQMPPIDTALESFRMPQMIQTEEQPSAFKPPSQLPANMLGEVPLQYQGTDLMHRIPPNPQLQTDFTLPEEVPSPQIAADRVMPPAVAQQQYQQLSSQQQLGSYPNYLYFPTPWGFSSVPMYSSFAHISLPQQPSSQMTPGLLPAQRNPEEIKKIEDQLQSFHIVKTLRPELGSKLDGVLQNARLDSSVGENTSDKTSHDDYYDSEEKFNAVEEDNDPTNSFNSELSGQFMTKTNQQILPGFSRLSRNDELSHNAPCASYNVIGDTDLQSPNQVEEDNNLKQTFSSELPGQCMAITNQQTLPTRLSRRQDPSPDAPSTSGMMTGGIDLQSPNQSPVPRRLTQDEQKEVMQVLAQKIKNRRIELSLNQTQVANQLNELSRKYNISQHNFTQVGICSLETGNSPAQRSYKYKNVLELWLMYSYIKNPNSLVNKPVYTFQRCRNTNCTPDSIFRARASKAATGIQDLGNDVQQNLPDTRHTGMLPKPIPMNKKVMMARSKKHHQLETAINLRVASSMPSSRPVTSPMVYIAPRSVVTAPGNSNNLSDIPTFTDNDEEDAS